MAGMSDTEIAKAAAERWGQSDPCPDDVINEHVPQYGEETSYTSRWHRIAALVYDMVVTPDRCAYCNKILHGKTQGTRHYCDERCRSKAYRARKEGA